MLMKRSITIIKAMPATGIGGTGRQHQQYFFLDIAEELYDSESGEPGNPSQDDQHKQNGSEIERSNQLDQRPKRNDAILADRKGHSAENAEGCEFHQDIHHAKYGMSQRVDQINQRLRTRANRAEREPEQDIGRASC